MAVFPSRLAYPAQYSADPVDIFVAGDTSLRYGKFVAGYYTMSSTSDMSIYHQESVWDDGYGEYVDEGVDNYVVIEANATGYTKLIITARATSSYDSLGKVGWGVAKTNSSSDTYTAIGTTTATDFEFDISGQSTIYIKIYSRYYPVRVRGIRLE